MRSLVSCFWVRSSCSVHTEHWFQQTVCIDKMDRVRKPCYYCYYCCCYYYCYYCYYCCCCCLQVWHLQCKETPRNERHYYAYVKQNRSKGQASLKGANNHWNNRENGVVKLGFSTSESISPKKLSEIWARAIKVFASPVLGWKCLKSICVKGCHIISLSRTPAHLVGSDTRTAVLSLSLVTVKY
jgi:hypothetical protein